MYALIGMTQVARARTGVLNYTSQYQSQSRNGSTMWGRLLAMRLCEDTNPCEPGLIAEPLAVRSSLAQADNRRM